MCFLCPASLKLWAFLCWLISPQLEAGVRKGERQPRVAAISCWGRRTALSHGVPLQTGLGADRSSSWKAARTFHRAFSPLPRSTFTFALTWIWLRAAVRCIYMARCQRSSLGTGRTEHQPWGALCCKGGRSRVTLIVGGCFKRPPAQPGSAYLGHQEVPP